eukprot:scaffold19762_cov65-Phaeocystis_antarctica.AAC.6
MRRRGREQHAPLDVGQLLQPRNRSRARPTQSRRLPSRSPCRPACRAARAPWPAARRGGGGDPGLVSATRHRVATPGAGIRWRASAGRKCPTRTAAASRASVARWPAWAGGGAGPVLRSSAAAGAPRRRLVVVGGRRGGELECGSGWRVAGASAAGAASAVPRAGRAGSAGTGYCCSPTLSAAAPRLRPAAGSRRSHQLSSHRQRACGALGWWRCCRPTQAARRRSEGGRAQATRLVADQCIRARRRPAAAVLTGSSQTGQPLPLALSGSVAANRASAHCPDSVRPALGLAIRSEWTA